MASIHYLALFCFVFGAFGQQCKPKCDDIYNPECVKTDYCCDIHEELDITAPCHNNKLQAKDPVPSKSSCCGQLAPMLSSKAFMFQDKCESRYFNHMVCRNPVGGSSVTDSIAWNRQTYSCPSYCTTGIDLLKGASEYFLDGNGQVNLNTSWKNSVHVEDSCQSYRCGFADRVTTEPSWNIVASTCLCMKKNILDDLDSKLDKKWNRCNGNDSLIESKVFCQDKSQLLKFDSSEYLVTGDDVAIDSFDWENPDQKINYQSKDNYCFGPAWTGDWDDIVNMRLFYCKSGFGKEPELEPACGVTCIASIIVIVVIVAIMSGIVAFFKLCPRRSF